MRKKNNNTQLINQVVDREIDSLKKELQDEYNKILDEMNKRGVLYSGITVSNVKKEGSEVISKYVRSAIKECSDFPFKVSKDDWNKIQDKLKNAIEDEESKYYAKLINLKINFSASPSLFQDPKKELERLIKESITKSEIEGFESESNYRLSSRKRANIAIFISILSVILNLLINLFIFLFKR